MAKKNAYAGSRRVTVYFREETHDQLLIYSRRRRVSVSDAIELLLRNEIPTPIHRDAEALSKMRAFFVDE